jgi:16S rRNA (cytidine1402-2'-O)-methyltransferase
MSHHAPHVSDQNRTDEEGLDDLAPALYITSTPIGNRGDITVRALDVLRRADRLLCEDTRMTKKLLSMYGLSRPLTTYHEHNADATRPKILHWLADGLSVALVSDAGTPLISDPGYKLVQACRADGHTVTAVPGASAILSALAIAGVPTDRFLFMGFLPHKAGGRRSNLQEVATLRATLVIYESPRRLAALLVDAAELWPDREAVVCRELTKRFEETVPGTLSELAAHYAAADTPKGEIVLAIAPPSAASMQWTDDALDAALQNALADGASVKDAAAHVAAASGAPRKQLYSRAMDLKNR